MERLRQAIETMVVKLGDGFRISVTISVGATQMQDGITPGQLVAQADASLYAAKHAGRNRVICHVQAPESATHDSVP